MKPWMAALIQGASFLLGALLVEISKRWIRRRKSWVVLVIYEALFEGDNQKARQFIFYLRKNRKVQGDESLAQKFWTERSARAAAAMLKLSGDADTVLETYLRKDSFRFLEIRIERIHGL